jgi:hypothetical protein
VLPRHFKDLPIIALMTEVPKGEPECCLAAGIDDDLPKPSHVAAVACAAPALRSSADELIADEFEADELREATQNSSAGLLVC